MSTETSEAITSSKSFLNDDDIHQVSLALSLIWTKLQYKLKNISVSNRMGTISYGKRTERITVNLQESIHLLTDQVLILFFE